MKKDKWLIAYCLILLVSLVDWFVSVGMGCPDKIRIRRVVRPFFLLQNSPLMKKTVKSIRRTLPQVARYSSLAQNALVILQYKNTVKLPFAELCIEFFFFISAFYYYCLCICTSSRCSECCFFRKIITNRKHLLFVVRFRMQLC